MPISVKMKRREMRPTAVGSYIFAGGFTVGVMDAGFDVRYVMEEGPYGVATFRHNRPDVPVFVGPDNWPINSKGGSDGRVDFVYGNPPCAAWSNAGSATKRGRTWDSSALVDCSRRHFQTLLTMRPHFWAWESVQRAWTLGRSLVDQFALEAAENGYSTTVLLHSAQYLGVPQKRDRFFMICHDLEIDFEEPSWETETIEEALDRVKVRGEPLAHNLGRHKKLLPFVRPGENLSSAWMRLTPEHMQVRGDRGQMVGRPPFTIKRARPNQPAPVVMHELIHPTEARGLSLRELATLCGYPQDFEFIGAKDAGQIGRGVCPPVGRYLAEMVRLALSRGIKIDEPTYRVVDMTKPPMKTYEVPFTSGEDDAAADQEEECRVEE